MEMEAVFNVVLALVLGIEPNHGPNLDYIDSSVPLRERHIARWVAIGHCNRSMSPESAVMMAASEGFGWPFAAVSDVWMGLYFSYLDDVSRCQELAREMIASPEWRDLPWQES